MAQSLYPPDSEYDIAKLPASPVHVSHIMLAVAQTWQPYFWRATFSFTSLTPEPQILDPRVF